MFCRTRDDGNATLRIEWHRVGEIRTQRLTRQDILFSLQIGKRLVDINDPTILFFIHTLRFLLFPRCIYNI